jgi:hypothetical protein
LTSSVDPLENTRIETSYRRQTVKQTRDPNPAGEDITWAEAMYRDFLRT